MQHIELEDHEDVDQVLRFLPNLPEIEVHRNERIICVPFEIQEEELQSLLRKLETSSVKRNELISRETEAISFLRNMNDRNLVVSFSGGKDSLVALDLAVRIGIEKAVFVDTTVDFEENLKFISEVEDYYGISIDRVRADIDFFYAVKRVGFPSRRLRWCCDVFKFAPLARYARSNDIEGFITGIRSDESRKRKTYTNVDNNPMVPCLQINPILNWSRDAVNEYIRKYGLPSNPLYQYVDRSGCWCCPFQTEKEWDQVEKNFPNLAQELRKNLEKFANEVGIQDKKRFIHGRGWTGWASPIEKKVVGIYKLHEENNADEWNIKFFARNRELEERVMKLLPILTDNFHPAGDHLRFIVGKGKKRRTNILIEKAINCIGCGACTAVCPKGALNTENGTIEVDPGLCDNCERCLNTRVLWGACVARHYSHSRRVLMSYH